MKNSQSVDEILTQIDSEEKKARSFRVLLTTIAILGALALVGLAINKTVQYVSAHENLILEKQKTEDALIIAQQEKQKADEARAIAEKEKREADEARVIAGDEKQRAEKATLIAVAEKKKAEAATRQFKQQEQLAEKLAQDNRKIVFKYEAMVRTSALPLIEDQRKLIEKLLNDLEECREKK